MIEDLGYLPGLNAVKAGRENIMETVDDIVMALVFKSVEKQDNEIDAAVSGLRLENGRAVVDAITDLIIDVIGVTFDVARKFDGMINQTDIACESLLRDYAELDGGNGQG